MCFYGGPYVLFVAVVVDGHEWVVGPSIIVDRMMVAVEVT